MSRYKKLIPFRWLPASWGLNGPLYDEAEAYYLYDGYDLERRLAEIKLTGDDLTRELLRIDHEYQVIDAYTHSVELAKLENSEIERKIAQLTTDIEYGVIDEKKGQKEIATLRGEPWIAVINDDYDSLMGPNGYSFEFDWNELWITMLREHGYIGTTGEDVVQQWFTDLCRNELSQSMGPTIGGNSGIY